MKEEQKKDKDMTTKERIKRDLSLILPEDTSDDLITQIASYIEVLVIDREI